VTTGRGGDGQADSSGINDKRVLGGTLVTQGVPGRMILQFGSWRKRSLHGEVPVRIREALRDTRRDAGMGLADAMGAAGEGDRLAGVTRWLVACAEFGNLGGGGATAAGTGARMVELCAGRRVLMVQGPCGVG